MNEAAFATALLDPKAAVPAGIIDPQGRPAPKRFSVYRNNVTSSLILALEVSFPVIRKLVGIEFFAAMALEFLRSHPPKSGVMMLYGADFPEFLATFPPAASLGYLPDVARLEQAIRESYHAADATPLPPDALANLTEAQLLDARLQLAPSLRLVPSVWPVHMIWRANSEDGPKPTMQAEDVVIMRPGFDPAPHVLPAGGCAFVAALLDRQSLGSALSCLGDDTDLTAILGLLSLGHAIVGIEQ